MQLKAVNIQTSLAAACCALLSANTANADWEAASSASTAKTNSSFDAGLLSYTEEGGRVKTLEPIVVIKEVFPDESAFSLNLTLDTLSGASPNGALPSKKIQTFSTPSGKTLASTTVTTNTIYQTYTSASGQVISVPAGSTQAEEASKNIYTVAPGDLPVDTSFRDERKAINASYSYPWFTNSKLNLGGAYSQETDFTSVSVNAGFSQDFFQKNTTFSISTNLEHDGINPIGGTPVPMSDYGLFKRESNQTKRVTDLVFGVTQVINRRWLMHLNYAIDNSNGYQNDPYKILSGLDTDGNVVGYINENRPTARTRKSVYWENKIAVGNNDVLDFSYRRMSDDWGITSDTADFSYRLQFEGGVYFEPHYRVYKQTAADFYRLYLTEGQPLLQYASADPRLAALDSNTVGIKIGYLFTHTDEINFRIEKYKQQGKNLPTSLPTQLQGLDLYPGLSAWIVQAGIHFDF